MDGGYVHGRDGVRSYWQRQWAIIDPNVEPVEITTNGEGEVIVTAHQVVYDLNGNLEADKRVTHVFQAAAIWSALSCSLMRAARPLRGLRRRGLSIEIQPILLPVPCPALLERIHRLRGSDLEP